MVVDWIFFILSMKVLNLVLRWFLLNVKNEFFKGYDLICLFFNIEMGKIWLMVIYFLKIMVEVFDIFNNNEVEVMKLFLYDNKGKF